MRFTNLKRLFKRKEIETGIDLEDYQIPSIYDELTEMICDFVEKNNNDHLSTQIILKNGKSVLVSYEMVIKEIPRGYFISIYDKKGIEIAIINLNDISALGRVPKGKHVMGV